MNVIGRPANDAFSPFRGTDEQIQAFPKQNGAVYFAYDTKRIYFDRDNQRYQMSGNGILFVYGDEGAENIILGDDGLYKYPRNSILPNYHYELGSIIINSDGTFYKIIDLDDIYAYCDKLMVAGVGGGSIADEPLQLKFINPMNVHPYGRNFVLQAIVIDRSGYGEARPGSLKIDIYNSEKDYHDGQAPRFSNKVQFVRTGEQFSVELQTGETNAPIIPGDHNYIVCQATVSSLQSKEEILEVDCKAISFKPTPDWQPAKLIDTRQTGVRFPFTIDSSLGSELPNDINVDVFLTLTDGDSNIKHTLEKTGENQIHVSSGGIEIDELLNQVSQGGHTLTVKAVMHLQGGIEMVIGDYFYGIGVYKGLSGENAKPIIWSPYHEEKVENYTLIEIPYKVYDPHNNPTTVEFFINNEPQVSQEVGYTDDNNWVNPPFTIAEYKVDDYNTFTIQCGDTIKEFQVYVEKNFAINLDAVQNNLVLYLNALGRSNLETSAQRATWPNKGIINDPSLGLKDIEFKDFNWANNGWVKDDEGNTCLRVSNGASVIIPITTMANREPQPFTYEFDFKVRNAIDYSRLIIEKTVQKLNEDGSAAVDDDGTPILVQEKTVSTGEGAFLTYFDPNNKHGFMLGTQEAFFSLSDTAVVNARYTDQKRVKVSIVVDANGINTSGPYGTYKFIYFYINGVLTSVMQFNIEASFENEARQIVINSKYCDVDLYNIRIYKAALNYQNITQNWIGDAPTLQARHDRYNVNNALVLDNKLNYEKVRQANIIPTMVITTYNNTEVGAQADNQLPYYKGSKKAVGVRFWNPFKPEMSFHCQNVELDVQGTSSQAYPRRNYKLKTKEKISDEIIGWTIPYKVESWDGDDSKKDYWYQDHDDDSKKIKKGKIDIGNGIPVREFCLKADYMDSSGTHNTQFADYIQVITTFDGDDKLGLRHPLNKDFKQKASYRTTVYGFPMLLFWEKADGAIEFVGKYNFNIDKGATDAFGFSLENENEYTPLISRDTEVEVETTDPDTGEITTTTEIQQVTRHATFAEVAECWEFCQNQSGLGKFQGDKGFYETIPLGEPDANKYQLFNHFEPRYTYDDIDLKDIYESADDVVTANNQIRGYTANFERMWTWVNSTDTNNASNDPLPEPIYYTTLSKTYEYGVTYYKPDDLTPVVITPMLTYKDEEKDVNPPRVSSYAEISNPTLFEQFLEDVNDRLTPEEEAQHIEQKSKYAGVYAFVKHDDGLFYYQFKNEYKEASAQGITVPTGRDIFVIEVKFEWNNFKIDLKERFDTDSIRYRKAKFKNELKLHFDQSYMSLYFILTELFLCYDSRQKNMMLATWGPTQNGGDYIWYPIFYDIDTQLGVNNSGHISWDYDTDATLVSTKADGQFDDKSIFSGAGSVLWMNYAGLFMDEIQTLYRELRKIEAITAKQLITRYNGDPTIKERKVSDPSNWSEIIKNIDADYKYLAPAVTGYINQQGLAASTSTYFYCIQGDRALNRETFFQNRINYIDSQWLAGSYDPYGINTQIKIRYNANDTLRTPDRSTLDTQDFDTDLTLKLHAYLSQYLSAIYDETATAPQKYIAGQDMPITVVPPASIQDRLNDGVLLSQQLAYIRGPEYISDLGDLSSKYINELDYSAATRLRTFKLGSLKSGYYNDNIGAEMVNALSVRPGPMEKGLLKFMDLSNIRTLSGPLDLTGCEKLETLMASGTTLSSVSFTEGNMLKTLYLPETVDSIILKQPLELRGLISTAPTEDNTTVGLYIENLTDKLNTVITRTTSCRIKTFVLAKTKMGIDSYRLLKYLYDVKEAKFNGLIDSTTTTDSLACDLTDVEWSPYQQLENDAVWQNDIEYYELVNNAKYEQWNNGIYNATKWANDIQDGVLYIKDANFDTTVLQDLTIINKFIEMYTNDNYTVEQGTYRYKSTKTEPTQPYAKFLPSLSGRIHINNAGGAPIDEYTVWSWRSKDKYYPDLEITADNMTPALSVHFIEYRKENKNDENNTAHSLAWVKYAQDEIDTPVIYPYSSNKEPERLHYDFQGWALDNEKLRTNESIITDADTDIQVIPTAELSTYFPSLAAIEGGRLTLVAVFKIHGYHMTFYESNGSTEFIKFDVPAGQKIGPYLPQSLGAPYKDDTNLELKECYKFIGWHITNDSTEQITDLNQTRAMSDMNFFPKYTIDSVYNNVLPQECLEVILTSATEFDPLKVGGYAACVGIKPEFKIGKNLGKKICFPIKVRAIPDYIDGISNTEQQEFEYDIAGIIENSLTDTTSNGLKNNNDLFAIFFKGCEENATEKSKILQLGYLENCHNLVWVDIPDSVIAIKPDTLKRCPKLEIENVNNVKSIGTQAFYESGRDGNATTMTMTLDSNFERLGDDALANTGWREINLGSFEHRFNYTNYHAIDTATIQIFGQDNIAENDTVYLQKINVYCVPDMKNDLGEPVSRDQVKSLIENVVYNIDIYKERFGDDFVTII